MSSADIDSAFPRVRHSETVGIGIPIVKVALWEGLVHSIMGSNTTEGVAKDKVFA